ncbi:MAG: hypothetical protein VX233_06220 [Candidatus Neomarinimicrobiota bacterium]|nr:hypothetical protein [Candidatus Neomarinimicrobiota bacterium]
MIIRIIIMRLGFSVLLLSLTLAENPLSRTQTRPLITELNKQMGYFRMELDERSLSFSEIENNNTLFTMPIKTRRNNYEEIILLSYGCIGRSIQNQLKMSTGTGKVVIVPSIVSVDCTIPLGRDDTRLATSINHKTAVQFAEGFISSQEFWQEIMNSAEASSNMEMNIRTPAIFMTDVDFENLIAARIALEGKGNPKVDNILSLASKASYIPGLESKLENMLVDHMKTKHFGLMSRVLGYEPAEEQIVRIGKQFFYHAQKPYIEVKEIHISDSLRYVWKGNKYPQVLDQHYQAYRLQQN